MPSEPNPGDITVLLHRVSAGDRDAETALIHHVYRDLRRLAAHYLRRERSDHTLQPTALVNEAYLRMVGTAQIQWQDRSHFFRVAATVMRRILVDEARSRRADKRGGDRIHIPFDEVHAGGEKFTDLVIDVDRALTNLALIDERQAQVVEMRFFGGLSEEEIACCLATSTRTVKREWAMARAWLKGELGSEPGLR